MALERRWIAKTWDSFQLPKPFSRACVLSRDHLRFARR